MMFRAAVVSLPSSFPSTDHSAACMSSLWCLSFLSSAKFSNCVPQVYSFLLLRLHINTFVRPYIGTSSLHISLHKVKFFIYLHHLFWQFFFCLLPIPCQYLPPLLHQSKVYLTSTREFVNFFIHSKPVRNTDLRLGLAVGYAMRHHAVPLNMTMDQNLPLLKATNLMLKIRKQVSYCKILGSQDSAAENVFFDCLTLNMKALWLFKMLKTNCPVALCHYIGE